MNLGELISRAELVQRGFFSGVRGRGSTIQPIYLGYSRPFRTHFAQLGRAPPFGNQNPKLVASKEFRKAPEE
jgi:hypothetical protein